MSGSRRAHQVVDGLCRAQLVVSRWCSALLVVHELVMEDSAGGEGVV